MKTYDNFPFDIYLFMLTVLILNILIIAGESLSIIMIILFAYQMLIQFFGEYTV